jgi:Domain of unknown function (DUF4131)
VAPAVLVGHRGNVSVCLLRLVSSEKTADCLSCGSGRHLHDWHTHHPGQRNLIRKLSDSRDGCRGHYCYAHVTSEGNVQSDGTGGFHERVEVETEKTEWENQFFKNHIGVMLSLYSANGSARSDAQGGTGAIGGNRIPLLHYGQRIRFRAALNPPRNYRNPGAVEYAGYLRDCGITALASTKAADLELLPGFSGSRPELWRARVHRSS